MNNSGNELLDKAMMMFDAFRAGRAGMDLYRKKEDWKLPAPEDLAAMEPWQRDVIILVGIQALGFQAVNNEFFASFAEGIKDLNMLLRGFLGTGPGQQTPASVGTAGQVYLPPTSSDRVGQRGQFVGQFPDALPDGGPYIRQEAKSGDDSGIYKVSGGLRYGYLTWGAFLRDFPNWESTLKRVPQKSIDHTPYGGDIG